MSTARRQLQRIEIPVERGNSSTVRLRLDRLHVIETSSSKTKNFIQWTQTHRRSAAYVRHSRCQSRTALERSRIGRPEQRESTARYVPRLVSTSSASDVGVGIERLHLLSLSSNKPEDRGSVNQLGSYRSYSSRYSYHTGSK